MKRSVLIASLLASLAPVMSAWGSSTTTYYAALKVSVSSSGGGKVYASTSNSAPAASSYKADSSQSGTQSSTTKDESKNFYAFASANDGYEFSHWSTSNDGTSASTANPYTVGVECSGTESSPTLTTVYAVFKKKTLAAFDITFVTSDAGTFTVDGAAPANKTGLTEATSVVLASTDPNFLSWNVGGTTVSDNPYTATCLAATTIGANFLTADQVTTATTYEELTAALANAQYLKITIPSGTEITVAKGTTLTVPSGKQLVVDGNLVVVGAVANSGAITGNGTLYKVSYLINQGDLQIVYQADGTECKTISETAHHSGESAHYYKTKVTVNTPSVSGTVSMTPKWGVLLDGQNVYAISAQSIKGVQVSLDTSVAANKITGIVGSLTTTDISSGETSGKKNWVLFADCNLKGPVRSDATTRLNFNGTIDLCGHKLTFGQPRTYSDFFGVYLNGTIEFTPSTDCQNGGEIFFNCSSVTIKNIKGTPNMTFYDCGTEDSPATLTFGYQSGAHRKARFFGGCYRYTFTSANDSSYSSVYGGSYTSDPSDYLADVDKLEVKYNSSSKYYVVQEKKEVTNVAVIGETPYETLAAAVDAAVSGDTISLTEAVDLTGETLEIPAEKNITIALDKHTVSGGKIVNRGTLVLTDSGTGIGGAVTDASGATVASDIENYGVLNIIFGTYSGAIDNKAGTLTTHNGIFSGTLTKSGGTVNLKGGHFTADITALATVDGCDVTTKGGKYTVCVVPDGTMRDTTVSSAAGYGAKPYSDSDYDLLKVWVGGKSSRTDYSAADWQHLAELLCFYQVFNNKGMDPTLVFDREVATDSLTLNTTPASGGLAKIKFDVAAGTTYRALTETLMTYGAYAKTYKAIFSENISSVAVSVSDKSGNNVGTVCKTMIELWEGERAPDYSSTRRMITNTVFVVGQKLFTIGAGSNAAMIRPATGAATFYATLGAAMNAAADGGTVMLANDCGDNLLLNKAGTYTFDTMGFAFTGEVTVGNGLELKSSTATTSAASVLVPDAVATTYVVAPPPEVATVDGQSYSTIAEAVEAATAGNVEMVVTAPVTETLSLDAGKTLAVTIEDGVSATITVTPAQGAFIETENGGTTTTYVSKQITVEMAEPAAGVAVEVTKTENGEESAVTGAEAEAAVASLMGNVDVPRTDNTDKLDVLDLVTVTPSKIVEEIVGGQAILRSATFDVVPNFKAGQSLGEGQTLKFRLPVDAAATQVASVVYHAGAQFGVYPVRTGNGQKFIEVESSEFSPYGYTLLDGETETPVAAIGTTGYETLEAALSAASNGDTVTLLADIADVGGTLAIEKSITIDGGGHSVTAAANAEPRDVVSAYSGSRIMFDIARSTPSVTFRDITLDGGEGHYYTFLIRSKIGTATLDGVTLLHGAEADASGEPGVGYGAGVQVDGGTVVVTNGFVADTGAYDAATGDRIEGVFPFTAILYQSGALQFANGATADIGGDLLLVGMVGAVDVSDAEARAEVQEMLDGMNVPSGFSPYTLKVGDSELTAFTGASPLGWNDIIDYGAGIMTVAGGLGMDMDPETTPVEAGLLADTALPEPFVFSNANFTVNGNGNALSGTIVYTDDAGTIGNIDLGKNGGQLVLDLRQVTDPVTLGDGVSVVNVKLLITEEQAELGTPVFTWDADGEATDGENIAIEIFASAEDTEPVSGEDAELVWDEESGIAYIGPCEARLTGPTHDTPIYTTLAGAIAQAAGSGDTVTLLADIEGFTGTQRIGKSITLDGAGHAIAAAPVAEHRNMFEAWAGGTAMLKLEAGAITLRNITLDGDATHAYTYLVSADNASVSLTTENVRLLHGGEQSLAADGETLTAGSGYGAAIHLNNGASITVRDGFYACTGGEAVEGGETETGIFPFTGILPEGDASVLFDLAEDTDANPTVTIGGDLLLVGMVGAIDPETAQGILDYMQVPSRFIPYTLTLDDGSAYAFTGASPRTWNDIIDYGKDIIVVATANGFEGLDGETTQVEVGLLTDTVLPDTFVFEDANFTVNGNGNALSGTIVYTDNAGTIGNIDLGKDGGQLVLDLRQVTDPVTLGEGVTAVNVKLLITEEQAELGTPVFTWDADGEALDGENIAIEIFASAEDTEPVSGEDAELVWDEESGIAYIGPCEARLTGPTHDTPIYTTLAGAVAQAAGSGDTVTLLADAVLAASVDIGKSVALDLNGQTISLDGNFADEYAIGVVGGAAVAISGAGRVDTGDRVALSVEDGTAAIGGGTFAGAVVAGDDGVVAISGGNFADPIPAGYCAAGYFPNPTPVAVEGESFYTVQTGYAAGDRPGVAGDGDYALSATDAEVLNATLARNRAKSDVDGILAGMSSVEAFQKAMTLNINIAEEYAEPSFRITAIRRNAKADPVTVTVTVTLDRNGNEIANAINGVVALKTSPDGKVWGEGSGVAADGGDDDFSENGSTVSFTMPAANNNRIFKAVIEERPAGGE